MKKLDIPPEQRYQDKSDAGIFMTLAGVSLDLKLMMDMVVINSAEVYLNVDTIPK